MSNNFKSDIESARKSSETDSFLAEHLWNPVGMVFSKLFIKLHIVPNGVTFLSLLTGVAGGILFYFDKLSTNLIGFVLLFLSTVFDVCDGQVARLTHNSSPLGRFFDGFCDTLVAMSNYLAITFKVAKDCIPFTDIRWGFWIFPIAAYCGFVAHRRQCYMADYYRNIHLFFLRNKHGSELTRSSKIAKQISELKGNEPFVQRFYLNTYKSYTEKQEKHSPKFQKLLNCIEENGNVVPDELREDFLTESRKYVKYSACLTFNLRTAAMLICIFLGLHVWFFAFVVTVPEVICFKMMNKYEQIAEQLCKKYFGNNK